MKSPIQDNNPGATAKANEVALAANIAVDSLGNKINGFGASTSATQNSVPTASNGFGSGVTPSPTKFNVPAQTQEQIDAQAAQDNFLSINKANATNSLDANTIYQQKLTQAQAEIDATNKIYDDMISQARVQGTSRLGSARSAQFNGGLIGSPTGGAQTDAVITANNGVESSINDQRQARLSAILSGVKSTADAELAAKTLAKSQGAQALLDFYSNAPTRKAAALSPIVKLMIAQGYDPAKVTPDELNGIASQLKVAPQDIISAYTTELSTQASAKTASEKAAAEAAKAGQTSVTPGEQVYQLQSDGTYKLVASQAPKTETQVVLANGKKLLIDSNTGAVIKDLGSSSSGTGTGTGSTKEMADVKRIIAANPGEYNKAAEAIDAKYGKGASSKYDNLLKSTYLIPTDASNIINKSGPPPTAEAWQAGRQQFINDHPYNPTAAASAYDKFVKKPTKSADSTINNPFVKK